jgi:hypothetical protein
MISVQRQLIASIPVLAILAAAAGAAAQDRGPAGTVTLPRTEYDRLLDLSMRAAPSSEGPPAASTMTRADVHVRVQGSAARTTYTLEGEVFQNGAAKVPLLRGATLVDARMDAAPLPLLAEGDACSAVLMGPGTYIVTLEAASPIAVTPGRAAATIPVPLSASATARIDVPGERSDVRVSPGVIVRRESAGGRTVLDVSLTPGTPLQIAWSSRDVPAGAAPARDVRLLSDVKTLITLGDAEVTMTSLVSLTIVQGQPSEVDVDLPAGYEIEAVNGSTVDRTADIGANRIRVFLAPSFERRLQFVVVLRRGVAGSTFSLDTGLPSVAGAQRESGEAAVEGVGALDVVVTPGAGLRRVDVRELDRQLAASARDALLSAFRYQRASAPHTLTLDVTRFPSADVLAAVAERAVATTLVTVEGRALTEISLWVKNRAQAYAKIALPLGATMVSVEVEGQPAKPVEGADGVRIPLLRPGFRPSGTYNITFVYLHAGTPFARKGDMTMTLPRMELPVSFMEWELFVPGTYRADRFGGNVIPAELVDAAIAEHAQRDPLAARTHSSVDLSRARPGSVVGAIVDPGGRAIPGVTVAAQTRGGTRTAITDADGHYVLSDLPTGRIVISAQIAGFKTAQRAFVFNQTPQQADFTMQIGVMSETVTVMASPAPPAQTAQEPSANVQSLQQRAAGVLPIRIEVPRTGTSHRFVRPLTIDEDTVVKFRYRRR